MYPPPGIVPAHVVPSPGSMARDHAMYRPRHAEASVLHAVIRQHLDDFLRAAADRADGAGHMELIATIDDPAVIHRILAHLGLPGARDGPAPAVALSPPRDDQATSPFALPSGSRRPAGPGGRLPVATGAPWCRGVPGPPTAAVRPRPWTL